MLKNILLLPVLSPQMQDWHHLTCTRQMRSVNGLQRHSAAQSEIANGQFYTRVADSLGTHSCGRPLSRSVESGEIANGAQSCDVLGGASRGGATTDE